MMHTLLRSIPITFAACALLSTPPLHAAWEFSPSARLETRYDRNMHLAPNGAEHGPTLAADLQGRVGFVNERSRMLLLSGASPHRRFNDGRDDAVRVPIYADLTIEHERPRKNVGFDARYRREDLLRHFRLIDSARPGNDGLPVADDPFTEGDPDRALFAQSVQRTRLTLSPHATFDLSPRTKAMVRLNATDLEYRTPTPVTSLQAHRSYSAMVGLQRGFSQRDSGWLRITRSRFEPERSTISNSWDAQLGWRRQMTERTSLTFGGGVRHTDFTSSTGAGVLFNFRFDQRTETGERYLLVERSLLPDAFGALVENDRISLAQLGRITDRIHWSLRANVNLTESAHGEVKLARRYATVVPEVRWNASPSVSLRASYHFRWIEREHNDGTAYGNGFALSLAYAPPRRL